MKRLLFCVLVGIPLIACDTASRREEPGSKEARLIELLRKHDYTEASADTGNIGRALFFYIRELRESEAKAPELLQACDYYLTHYPFSLDEFSVNLERLEFVAASRSAANGKSQSADNLCCDMGKIHEFGAAYAALEKFPQDHRDGGNCGSHFYGILKERAIRGRGWSKTSTLPANGELAFEDESYYLRNYFEAMARAFPDDVWVLLAGLRVGEFRHKGGAPALDAYWLEELSLGPWSRLYFAHLSWQEAQEIPPGFSGLEHARNALGGNGSPPKLQQLGNALIRFNERYEKCQSQQGDPVQVQDAAGEILALAPRTPLAELVRMAVINAYLMSEQWNQGEQQLRGYLGSMALGDHHASVALHWLGSAVMSADPARAKAIFAEAIRDYPAGAATPLARLGIAKLNNGEDERIRILKSLMNADPVPWPDPRSRFTEEARGEATRALGAHYRDRREWDSSLAAWQAWKPQSWCGTCLEGLNVERESSIGRCCEELGRNKEAMKHYWNAAPVDLESAKRLKALHEKSGTLTALKAMTMEKLEKYKRELGLAPSSYEGLKWLEDNLQER